MALKNKTFHLVNKHLQQSPAALLSARAGLVPAPGAHSIGGGALRAVTRLATVVSPIASRTVPPAAAILKAEVLCSVTTTLALLALPVLVVLPVALLAVYGELSCYRLGSFCSSLL